VGGGQRLRKDPASGLLTKGCRKGGVRVRKILACFRGKTGGKK